MVKKADKILRIGIIQGGRLFEERLIRKNGTVTLGESTKSTFVLPMAEMPIPKIFPIFDYTGDKYNLNFTSAMKGKLTVGGKVVNLSDLVKQGKAIKKGKAFSLTLNDQVRGKVTIGEVTVLFQYVVAPPLPPKAKLPASMRGGWIKGIDWPYNFVFLASLILHVGFFGYASTVPIPKKISLDKLDDRFAQFVVEQLPEEQEPEPVVEESDNGQKVEKKAEKDEVTPPPTEQMDPAERAAREAKRKREIEDKVRNSGLIKLIGTNFAGGEGSSFINDTLSEGAARGSIEDTIAGVDNVGIATDGNTRGRRGSEGGPESRDIAAAGVGEGGREGLGGRKETAPKAKMSTGGVDVDGELSGAQISKVIRKRSRAVQGCYESELRRNPKLKGKVSVEFTIATTGKVSKAKVVRSTLKNSTVEKCITRKMKAWRFPKPDGGSVIVETSFVFMAQR